MAIMKFGFIPAKLRKLETVSFNTAPAAMSTATKMRSRTDRPSFFWSVAMVRFAAAMFSVMIPHSFLGGFPPVFVRPRTFRFAGLDANEESPGNHLGWQSARKIKNLSFEIKDRFGICGATFIDFP